MQSDIILHPPTPRYDLKFANAAANHALLTAVLSGRDFSFLLDADELRQRTVEMRPARQAAERLARSYGYGCGYNQGD